MSGYVTLPVPPRIQRLKDELFATRTEFCFERARIVTRVYQETEGQHTALRRAKALYAVFDEMPLFIRPGELIVGQRAATLAGRSVEPEFNLNGLTPETTPNTIWDYWRGNTLAGYRGSCLPWRTGSSMNKDYPGNLVAASSFLVAAPRQA